MLYFVMRLHLDLRVERPFTSDITLLASMAKVMWITFLFLFLLGVRLFSSRRMWRSASSAPAKGTFINVAMEGGGFIMYLYSSGRQVTFLKHKIKRVFLCSRHGHLVRELEWSGVGGKVWWWKGEREEREGRGEIVPLDQPPSACSDENCLLLV